MITFRQASLLAVKARKDYRAEIGEPVGQSRRVCHLFDHPPGAAE